MRISDPLFSGNTVISGSFKVSGSFNVNDNDLSAGAVGFPFSGSAAVTGSLNVTGSILLNGEQVTISKVPVITTVYPLSVKETDESYTIEITGSNFDGNAQGYLVGTDGNQALPTTSTRLSETNIKLFYSSSARLSNSLEPYDTVVVNGNGENTTIVNNISVNDKPLWITEAGRLGSIYVASNITASLFISASDEEGDYPISYSLETGVLPTGLTLITSSGEITGSGAINSGSGDTPSVSGVQYNLTFKATDNAGVYATRNFNILLKWNDGSSAATAAVNAEALQDLGITTDGVYWVKPNNSIDAFQVYCDMTNFGGAWMAVSKWYQDAPYSVDELFNANARNADTTYLLNGSQLSSKSTHARLSRDQMNALWEQSNHIARVWTTDGTNTTASPYGTYFQKKITNTSGFDFWNAHYSSRLWSDDNLYDTSYIKVPGTEYKLTHWEGNGNVFTDSTYTDFNQPSYSRGPGWWDHVTVTAPNYGTIYATRHMGFYADITAGNQWILTCNPSDTRFSGTDSAEGKRTIVYLK